MERGAGAVIIQVGVALYIRVYGVWFSSNWHTIADRREVTGAEHWLNTSCRR